VNREGDYESTLTGRPRLPRQVELAAARDLGSGLNGSEAGQPRGCGLSFVVGDERVQRVRLDRSRNVDRVERSERRFGERASSKKQRTVGRNQADRTDDLTRSIDQGIEGKSRIEVQRPA
jgi:hypothetical protein